MFRKIGLLVLIFSFISSSAVAITAEEVAQLRQQREEAARIRAAALSDLNDAVVIYDGLQAQIGATSDQLDRIDARLSSLEEQETMVRQAIREHAVNAYMGEVGQISSFSVEGIQQNVLIGAISDLLVLGDSYELNNLLVVAADIENLREVREADRRRLEELEIDAAAVVDRMNTLFADAQATYVAANRRYTEANQKLLILAGTTSGFICPVAGPNAFTDTWGDPRGNGRTHHGTDINAAPHTPLVAVEDGWIVGSGRWDSLGGHTVRLRDSRGVEYFYAHMDAPSIRREGEWVSRGTVIGYVGISGNALSYHLHFGLFPYGGWVNPINPYPALKVACG